MKPYIVKRVKNGWCCSRKCSAIHRKSTMSGKNNHQFGLKGSSNASFIGAKKLNQYGYVMLYLPNHPKSDNCGRYKEHRYMVEQCPDIDNYYFDVIDSQRVLKSMFDVHHINGKRQDNRIGNLLVLTRSEHTTLHNKTKQIVRDNKGRIIGVIKLDELLENHEDDNQQPSLSRNTLKGSSTSRRVTASNVGDSNSAKSVQHK